ncbi:MAG: glycosyltransferase family 1 protein [Alphaproteobacteria bacterium]|nr:glycosyltransferase family 1 protein [Alphaproteobacteria bacterium]
MRIALITDAWAPQINGVARTLKETVAQLRAGGHAVRVIAPHHFRTLALPGEPDIRLALGAGRPLGRLIDSFAPDVLHVATEGPLGWTARRHARRRGLPLTSAVHTRFPDYLRARAGVPAALTASVLRRFHRAARRVLVPTPSLLDELRSAGFGNLALWPRGVDAARFSPGPRDALEALGLPRPVFLYVGRVAAEKNLPAFLAADLPGSKVVVGDGPALPGLRARFAKAHFLGARDHCELPALYRAADVFVFPSRTDTFGLVLLEALACGTPVAALPGCASQDVLGTSAAGALDDDLARAARAALAIPRERAADYGRRFSWAACTRIFLDQLQASVAEGASGRS